MNYYRHPFISKILENLIAVLAFTALVLMAAPEIVAQPAEFPVTYEAENATLAGVSVNDRYQGFTGSGYVAGFDQAGESIEFTISVPRKAFYTLRFRFLNGGDIPAIRTLLLDGVKIPGTTSFRNLFDFTSGDKTLWQTLDETVQLQEGMHTITLSFRESNGQGANGQDANGHGANYRGPSDQGDVRIDHMQVLDQTRPSMTSTRSLMMNNWTDLVAIHHSSVLDPADETDFGPRLAAIHWKGDWPTNQIDGATAYFRDDTSGRNYTDVHRFDSNLYFTEDGIMHVDYLNYGDEALPISISKQYAMVPNEPILLARYRFKNLSNENRTISYMELVDLNNLGANGDSGDSQNATQISATWHPEYDAWIADMSQTNGTFLVFGAYSFARSHAAGTPAEDQAMGKGSGLLGQFEDQGTLEDNEEITSDDILLAISNRTGISVGRQLDFTFFYSVQSSMEDAMAVAQQIREPGYPSAWFDRTRSAWQEWLDTGRFTLETDDPGINQAYTQNLIVVRQCQQPEFGSFVASTHPSYDYKVWPRDATVSALSLDAAGYYEEAEKFWMWMADVQEKGDVDIEGKTFLEQMPGGTWFTNYSYWQKDEPIDFVQPEWDSVGQFLIGVYHHWRLLNVENPDAAQQFLDEIYPAVVESAQWIAENVNPEAEDEYGFGPPGYSVWEEDFEYATYTQVTYASGLNAARLLAEQMGEPERADTWFNDAVTIRDNMLDPVESEPCGGLWDEENEFFIRGIFPPVSSESGECEPDLRTDASTDLIWVFGLLAADDPMVQAHRLRILDILTPPYQLPLNVDELGLYEPEVDFGTGISRYAGDTFYYSSEFSPGGQFESTVPMPSWPWMNSYMSMAEHWLGLDDLAFARMQWYVSVTGVGFMPTGEGVDWNTQQPLVSTMSQPDDGGYNLQIALLNYLDLFDPRLPPLEEQSGGSGE